MQRSSPSSAVTTAGAGAAAAIVMLAGRGLEKRLQQPGLIDHRPATGERRKRRGDAERGTRGGTFARRPSAVDQRAQAIEAAEVTLLRHRDVERGDRRAIDFGAVDLEIENAAIAAGPSVARRVKFAATHSSTTSTAAA